MSRQFEPAPADAHREEPLLIGLMGPPGGGKTYSALRLATGMAKVRGGEVYVIDTEKRAGKYRAYFSFRHVIFEPPFRPTDFLDAIKQQVARGAGAIVVDSMSDEHEGEGGVLDWHDKELDRMAGEDWAKRERVGQAAWIKPKADRRKLIDGMLRITVPIIMCFRAREKVKQIKNERGKMEPTNIGYQPIAPLEIVHNLDLNCLLPPRADGVPIWRSEKAGEDFVIKLPRFLQPFIAEGRALDEEMGENFARWAMGAAPPAQAEPPAPDRGALSDLLTQGDKIAREGMVELGTWWQALTPAERKALGPAQLDAWKRVAQGEEQAA